MAPTILQPGPPPDVTTLDNKGARRLLVPVMEHTAKVWAYASAAPEPGAAHRDEVLLTETGGRDLSVVWVRHPGSYTGATGHLLGGTGGHHLLRYWERWVFELADLVQVHADRESPTQWSARLGYMQADFLRWTARYGSMVYLSGHARDTLRDHGELAHDLGDLPPDGAARIAEDTDRGPATLVPPGWDLHGWDHARSRTHPILSGLRPDPRSRPRGPAR